MNVLWTAEEIGAALGVDARGFQATRVVIDSRIVQPGDVFVAVKGDHFDGHDFVQDAFAKGAVAAICERGVNEATAPVLVVPDALEALGKLAMAARARSQAKIIAVTGSVGKTSTKEALRAALSASGEVYATGGNFNNHIGLPLTLANLPETARFAVLEMGMNHAGEIAPLSRLARPHVTLITNVEAVHMEFFDSVQDIAAAKAEIFEGQQAGGVTVLNRDNAHFEFLAARARAKGLGVKSFGAETGADYALEQARVSETGTQILGNLMGTRVQYAVQAVGKHWAGVTLSVLAAAEAAGADLARTAEALMNFKEPVGRGRLSLVKMKHGDITLIDDSYNASPASMRAAFEKMRELKEAGKPQRRTVAVLGDMLELGHESESVHVGLIPSLINNQIDVVFASGHFMRQMFDTLPPSMRGDYALTAAGLAPKVVSALRARDLVLVKGSNGSKMKDVVNAIMAAEENDGEKETEHAL